MILRSFVRASDNCPVIRKSVALLDVDCPVVRKSRGVLSVACPVIRKSFVLASDRLPVIRISVALLVLVPPAAAAWTRTVTVVLPLPLAEAEFVNAPGSTDVTAVCCLVAAPNILLDAGVLPVPELALRRVPQVDGEAVIDWVPVSPSSFSIAIESTSAEVPPSVEAEGGSAFESWLAVLAKVVIVPVVFAPVMRQTIAPPFEFPDGVKLVVETVEPSLPSATRCNTVMAWLDASVASDVTSVHPVMATILSPDVAIAMMSKSPEAILAGRLTVHGDVEVVTLVVACPASTGAAIYSPPIRMSRSI